MKTTTNEIDYHSKVFSHGDLLEDVFKERAWASEESIQMAQVSSFFNNVKKAERAFNITATNFFSVSRMFPNLNPPKKVLI